MAGYAQPGCPTDNAGWTGRSGDREAWVTQNRKDHGTMGVEVYCRGRSNPTRGPKLGSRCIQTSPPVDCPSADNSRLLRRGEPLDWTKINPLDPEAWPT